MAKPAAKLGDKVVALDTHVVVLPSPAGPVPTPVAMPYDGRLLDGLSTTVCIDDRPAATKGSGAINLPAHLPAGGPFQRPPRNRATVRSGSSSVYIDDEPAARASDAATTCSDPVDSDVGIVRAESTVVIGD